MKTLLEPKEVLPQICFSTLRISIWFDAKYFLWHTSRGCLLRSLWAICLFFVTWNHTIERQNCLHLRNRTPALEMDERSRDERPLYYDGKPDKGRDMCSATKSDITEIRVIGTCCVHGNELTANRGKIFEAAKRKSHRWKSRSKHPSAITDLRLTEISFKKSGSPTVKHGHQMHVAPTTQQWKNSLPYHLICKAKIVKLLLLVNPQRAKNCICSPMRTSGKLQNRIRLKVV